MKLYYRIILSVFVTVLACISISNETQAQKQPVITATPLIGDSVKSGKTLTVQDTVYFNNILKPFIVQTKTLDNVVSLYINEFSNKVFPDTFNVAVRIRSKYTLANNDTASRLDTLKIFYSKNYPYNSKAIKFYKNYYALQVQILDVTITGAPEQVVRPLLVMENMIVIDRYFLPNCTAINSITGNDSAVLTAGELSISWPGVVFIPAYDLEWTFIDKSALDAGNYNAGGQLDPQLIFKNNATRLTITANSYRIPLLYDGEGTVFFRVRTVQNGPDGSTIPGAWSTESGAGGLGSYVFTGHERKLNWQATTLFAENGNKKSMIHYLDGSLKDRQLVTKDNTTGTTIVTETFYDKQGRKAIVVLPAPTLSTLIAYTPRFNVRAVNSAEYDKSVYDTLVNANDNCEAGADSMGTSIGASQYYSPSNPLASTGFHRYIPDAGKYPFAEVRYTPDNSGRIDRESGIGPVFQIGKGHETKYFYGTVEQRELDALFGTEAGDASHYSKTMTRDGNGQYNVTYQDMQGRTVATALAGGNPANLERLSNYDSITQTDKLLTPLNNIIKDNTIQATKSILVPQRGAYTFNYHLSPESLTLPDCKNINVCYDCLYDLTITITADCNQQITDCNTQQTSISSRTINLRNFSLFKADSVTHNLDTTCTAANIVDTNFCLTLEEGSYKITKVLSISREGMQYYRDSLFIPHNTCKSFNEFVLEQLDSLRVHLSCTPDSAVTNLAVAWRDQMMIDVTPLVGQYADTIVNRSCFSIFSTNGSGLYLFQTLSGYKDGDGNNDLVSHFNGTDWVLVPPQLLTPEEFIQQYRQSWGNTLLSLHPEYLLLLEYEKLKSAYTWEADFSQTETYAQAVAKGFLNPTGSASQPASRFTVSGKIDSLFNALAISDPGIVTSAKQSIDNSLFNYLERQASPVQYFSLWGLVTGIVKCNNNNDACYAFWNQNASVFSIDSLCTADLDMAWRLFRTQYLRIREDWVNNYTRQKSGISPGLITCIPVFPDRNTPFPANGQDYGGYDISVEQDIEAAHNNLDSFLLANCRAYAVKWMQDLAPCGYTQTDFDTIITRLTQVAFEGADRSHPFGSSTVKPSSTYIYRSFEQVITQYNQLHYPGKDPLRCNAYLIPNPKPYDQPGIIVNLPIIAAPDSCTCSKINGLYSQFISDSSRYHTFSAYMQQVHHTNISQGTLDTLRNLCVSSANCKYLQKPILLPPALQCNISDVCVDCNKVKTLNDSFKVKFPGAVPTKIETDSGRQLVNRVYANYMNAHLGFAKQAYEYLQFMETCSGQSSVSCDSNKWIVFNPGTNLLINADLYNNAVNNIPPYTQHFADGYFIGPPVTKGTHYVLVNKKDTLRAGTNTMMMQWRVKAGANSPMADPFIRRGGSTTYVGAEWIKDPADTTWWIGATILKAEDGDSLAGMGLESNSHGLLADWVKIINPSTGDLRYFYDFTSGSICNTPGGPYLCGKQAEDSAIILTMNPCADTSIYAVQGATYFYDLYLERLKGEFERKYSNKCLDAGKLEDFTVVHPLSEYQYTLHYFDQAGNHVKIIPPEGVHQIRRVSWLDSVVLYRSQKLQLVPEHTLATTYRHNSIGQPIAYHNTDAGLSRLWYDRLGRYVISQSAQQALDSNYTYMLYDSSGRSIETGQKKQVTQMTDAIARNPQGLSSWLNYTYTLGGTTVLAEQVTTTVFDVRDPESTVLQSLGYIVNSSIQKLHTLRNRVSYKRYYDKLLWTPTGPDKSQYDNSSTYSYDIHGNVDTLLHHYRTGMMAKHGTNQFKLIAYKYDLLMGLVREVHYQPDRGDQLYYRYEYDGDNKMTDVYISDRKQLIGIPVLEEHDERFTYYKHGKLAKKIIGQQQVQGVDYMYNLLGWLKGVNSDSLVDEDGKTGSLVANDAYRFSLNYFNGDYKPIGSDVQNVFASDVQAMGINAGDFKSLYNGNIASSVLGIPKLGETRLFVYKHDQLNRLVSMDSWKGTKTGTGGWSGLQKTQEYQERIIYDANGNIKTYLRNGYGSQLPMDNLTYQYPKDANGNILSNRLRYIHDQVAEQNENYPNDLHSQTALNFSQVQAERLPPQGTDNYQYDAMGNIIRDTKEGINNIVWDMYGKIRTIAKTDSTVINYVYDVLGNRLAKSVSKNGDTTTTWYVKDAKGGLLGLYTGANSSSLLLSEHAIRSSERIGTWNRNINIHSDVITDPVNYVFARGNKRFELNNQLGNVLVTISDVKINVDTNNNGIVDFANAQVITANDYAPFGMPLAGRTFKSGNSYRYGFNGKENDNEVRGEGNSIDFGDRIYDSRIGRFLSVDKLITKTPFFSPYSFAGNKPVVAIDGNGNLPIIIHVINVFNQPNGLPPVIEHHYYPVNITTVEDLKGVYRMNPSVVNITYTFGYNLKSTGPNSYQVEYTGPVLTRIKNDNNTGLTIDEDTKRNWPAEYWGSWVFGKMTKSVGLMQMAEAAMGEDYETHEKLNSTQRWLKFTEGVATLVSTLAKGASSGFGSWLQGKVKDEVFEVGLMNALEDLKVPHKEALVLAYQIGKYVKEMDVDKLTKTIADAIKLNVKGLQLVEKLKKDLGITGELPEGKSEALNKAVTDFLKNNTSPQDQKKLEDYKKTNK